MKIETELSDRCKELLDFFDDNNYHSRGEISIALDLTTSQITGTLELLKKRGYVFDTFMKNNYKHYKLSQQRLQPNTYAMTTKAVNERFAVELNRIRLIAIQDGYFKIEQIASQALNAGGLHTD
tara:strand:+ start:525 stop:896 length:372 start_codon:yes stop_codon:yes gene_type:complete